MSQGNDDSRPEQDATLPERPGPDEREMTLFDMGGVGSSANKAQGQSASDGLSTQHTLPSAQAGSLPKPELKTGKERYQSMREIGRGGMGRVLLAIDEQFGREGRTLASYRYSLVELVGRFARRNRRTLIVTGLWVLALIGALATVEVQQAR